MAEVQPGDVLAGKYRVERLLGEGGMGVVVAATHLALDERVALKLMRADALARQDGVARFLREARAAVKLKSEHVARVLDVGTLETGAPYIVMEHLEGEDLAHVLAARGALPVALAVDYVLQACDAIAEAHARGIIHRDLKPGNVFVTAGRDGAPLIKVLDFGISKVNVLGDRPESVTSSATLLGSPVYMSPEQMKSSRDVDVTADIWSLGIILYEAVGGRVPFDEQTMGALMAKVLTEPPPPLASLRPDLPAGFAAVVSRCLEKEPSRRFASVGELAGGLAAFGGPGADARVARILTMGRPRNEAAVSITPSGPALPSRPSILGVATTQAGHAGATTRPTGEGVASSRVGLYSAIAAATVVVGAAAFFGARGQGGGTHVRANASASASSVLTDGGASRGVVPEAPREVASAGAEPSVEPAPAPAPSSAASTPAAYPATPHPKVAPAAAPPRAPRPPPTAAAPSDPFGKSRQ